MIPLNSYLYYSFYCSSLKKLSEFKRRFKKKIKNTTVAALTVFNDLMCNAAAAYNYTPA